jgi:hypothetical protein
MACSGTPLPLTLQLTVLLFNTKKFGRNLASVAAKMFSRFIYFRKKFYKFRTSNAICKDNAAINCITLQHRKRSFQLTLTGHTTLVDFILAGIISVRRATR